MNLVEFAKFRADRVPPPRVAQLLGAEMRSDPAYSHNGDLIRALEALGWSVSIASLGAADGGLEALMAPRADGTFSFVVDPAPTPSEHVLFGDINRDQLRHWVINRRLAHEIAHVLFHGTDGRRLLAASTEEEEFCDVFAAHLVPEDDLIEPSHPRTRSGSTATASA